MKDIFQNTDSIKIVSINSDILSSEFEQFLKLKNYNSLIHFPNKDVNNFNKNKLLELIEYLKEEKAFVYGAYNKQELVGFIWGYPHIFFDEKRIFINCLVVEKEYEKKGIGKKLINKINEYASKNKYDSIDLTVAPFNKNAVGFYEHIGFKSERVQMYKSIGEKK